MNFPIGKRTFLTLCCLLGILSQSKAQIAKHVIVFGVDGLSPRGLADNPTPETHALMKDGVWTLHARAVIPTVSSPNWAAMIMGAAPDLTGITSNDWQPNKFDIAPACSDAPGIFPTIFGALHAKGVGPIGIFTDWPDFVRLVEPNVADEVLKRDEQAAEIMAGALKFWTERKPALLFIHLDFVDEAGHHHNWYSPEYNAAVTQMDSYLGQVRNSIEQSGLANDTILLFIADHGGHDKKHGSMSMTDIEIPWIAAGAGLPKNQQINTPVSTTQTAPSIAAWLGVSPQPCWMARPVAMATPSAGNR